MLAEDLQCLKTIALMGGCRGPVWISSQILASSLQTSPQTAARRLRSLEESAAITRSVRPDGQFVVVTRSGEEILRKEYADYRRIFDSGMKRYVLVGTVISGLGEGKYYMSLEPYQRQFMERLGFLPFPGTLNVRLNPASVDTRRQLELLEWIRIDGFRMENRTFGEAKCLPCRIREFRGALIVPKRTHYPEDVVEIISPHELRAELGVGDRDEIRIEITPD